jgi:hypothetical protein
MKIKDIMENASVGGTSAGSIAPVSTPLGGVISRNGGSLLGGKYTTDATPNTPEWMKKLKKGNSRAK